MRYVNPKRQELIDWLDSQPDGASWHAIAAWHGGASPGAIHAVLWRLREAGIVSFAGNSSRHGGWHTIRHTQTAQEAFERRRAEQIEARKIARHEYAMERNRRRIAQQQEKREAMGLPGKAVRMPPIASVVAEALAWSERPPEQRVIRAADAPPIPKRGPASAFELASWEAA